MSWGRRHSHVTSDLVRLHGGDDGGVDEGLGPLGRVLDQRLPLPRQPHKLLLLLVEVGVHAVLEVRRSRDLHAGLLLLGEHDATQRPASDLQRERRREREREKDREREREREKEKEIEKEIDQETARQRERGGEEERESFN